MDLAVRRQHCKMMRRRRKVLGAGVCCNELSMEGSIFGCSGFVLEVCEGPDDVIRLASKLGASADAMSCDGGTNGGRDGTSKVLSRLELVLKLPGLSGAMTPYFVVQRSLSANIVVFMVLYSLFSKRRIFVPNVDGKEAQPVASCECSFVQLKKKRAKNVVKSLRVALVSTSAWKWPRHR